MSRCKWLFSIFACLGAATVGGRAFAAQDFPFFICSSPHDDLRSFLLGKDAQSETGYTVWIEEDDGRWDESDVTVKEEAGGYAVSGAIVKSGAAFTLKLPVSCGKYCKGFAAVGPVCASPAAVTCTAIPGASEY